MSEKLGELLLKKGIITKKQWQDAIDLQQTVGGPLEDILIKLNFIDEEKLGQFKAKQEGLDFKLLDDFKPNATYMNMLPKDTILNEQVIPIDMNEQFIFLAMSHPEHVDLISEIEFKTGKTVKVVLSTAHSIDKCLNKYFYGTSKKEEEKRKKEVWEYTIDQIIENSKSKDIKSLSLYMKSLTQALIVEDRLDRNDLSRFLRINFKLDEFNEG